MIFTKNTPAIVFKTIAGNTTVIINAETDAGKPTIYDALAKNIMPLINVPIGNTTNVISHSFNGSLNFLTTGKL